MTSKTAPSPAPTPMPAFAPVERPLESLKVRPDAVEEGAGLDIVGEGAAVATVAEVSDAPDVAVAIANRERSFC